MRFSRQADVIVLVANSPVHRPAASDEAASVGAAAAPTAKRWLCIQHRAGLGAQARFALRCAGFEVHWPREVVRKPRQDDILRPLFPGYLFAQVAPDQNWGKAKAANYVIGIVGVREHGRPSLAPIGFVEALIARAGAIDLPIDDTPEARMAISAGRPSAPALTGAVRLTGGPFEGLQGILQADSGEERVRVLLEILGGSREVAVPRELVEQVT